MGNQPTNFLQQTKKKDWLQNSLQTRIQQQNNYIQVKEIVEFDPFKERQFNELKEQGNAIFKKIQLDCQQKTIDINKIRQKLSQSQLYYEQAKNNAYYFSQKAQIHKNIAVVNFKKIFYNCEVEQSISLLQQGIQNSNLATNFAQLDNKNPEFWYIKLEDSKLEAAREVINTVLNNQDHIQQQNGLIDLSNKISLELDPLIHLTISKFIFNIAENQIFELNSSDNIKDMLQAENLQKEINLNAQKYYDASQKLSSEDLQFYYRERFSKIDESNIEYQSYRYLYYANQVYRSEQNKKIVKSNFNFKTSDIIKDAIDAYKSAISAIKSFEGKFLEIEGECSFMLAQIYLEINGDFCEKAHNYLRNSIQLYLTSDASHRARCKKWYFEAERIMKLLQENNIMLNEKEFEMWKSNNLKLIEQIKLNQKNGCVDFINWVIKTHLPESNKDFKFKQDDYFSNKKLLIKCMRIFHGDKIVKETQHFKFIAKCIMEELSNFFNQIKEEQKNYSDIDTTNTQ
ncbi:hypothetical protein ABPG72_009287 [Tetrahymena utriculariae]